MPGRRLSIILIIIFLVFSLSSPVLASANAQSIITVTSSADSGPGTLRQALLEALAGDRIQFSPDTFPKANPSTISLLNRLPDLAAGKVTIDASDAGVVLDGSRLEDPEASGLRIVSDGNVILGLQIINFPADGIAITQGGSENTIGGATEGQFPLLPFLGRYQFT